MKETKKFWWEEKIDALLKEYEENEYMSPAEIKMEIARIIAIELNQ